MKYLPYALIAALILNFGLAAYSLYTVSTYNDRLAAVEQMAAVHDRVILEVICATRVSGIIDLARCSQIENQ